MTIDELVAKVPAGGYYEVVGPDGVVNYSRPISDLELAHEAVRTRGYSVRPKAPQLNRTR